MKIYYDILDIDIYYNLDQDNEISINIKQIVKNSLYNQQDEKLYKLELKKHVDRLYKDVDKSPAYFMENITIFKNKYNRLFKYEEEIYSSILDHASNLYDFKNQYELFKEDKNNDINIIKIIELLLDDSLNNNERAIQISIILKNINQFSYDNKKNIYAFICDIECKYPKVYVLYKKGFQRLLEDLKPNLYKAIKDKLGKIIFKSNTNKK